MSKAKKQSKAEGKILSALSKAEKDLDVELDPEDKWQAIELLREKQREKKK